MHSIIAYGLSIIGGCLYLEKIQALPVFLCLCVVIGALYDMILGKRACFLYVCSLLIGGMIFMIHPINKETQLYQIEDVVVLQGKITAIDEGDYGRTITLKNIKGVEYGSFFTKVQICYVKEGTLRVGDVIEVRGEVLEMSVPMNPSDFNSRTYLLGQNISMRFKLVSYTLITHQDEWTYKVKLYLTDLINKLFEGRDKGVMEAALLGEDQRLDNLLEKLYAGIGLSHVLCISGFHLGLVMSIFLALSTLLRLPYTLRYGVVLAGLWAYAFMTGMGTSTMRALVMSTLMIGARCLWEEEDALICLGTGAGVILLLSPYQLFAVGFQLSFGAVVGLMIGREVISFCETKEMKRYLKVMKVIMPLIGVYIITTPIIAYHFFEVPFLATLLNLIIIPLFSLIIIGGWISLLLGVALFPFGLILARGLVFLLSLIEVVCGIAEKWPFATWCTGRPSMISILIYYSSIVIFIAYLRGYHLKKIYYQIWIGASIGYYISLLLLPVSLEIATLYVGQGDGIVITTPTKDMIIIDGGNTGKGRIVENYIKYKGKKEVTALIVSHSDSDHISGLIELVEGDLRIEHAFISKADKSPLLDQFVQLCEKEGIAVHRVGATDQFTIGKVEMQYIGPVAETIIDANNSSLIGLLKYKDFSALFTGDKEKEFESYTFVDLPPISVLKASHHGSRTGMSESLLLNLKPQYVMISCGIDNRYNHPHIETLSALESCEVNYGRTDKTGTLWVHTDGTTMTQSTYREEEGKNGSDERVPFINR